jgi:hypothetical protein
MRCACVDASDHMCTGRTAAHFPKITAEERETKLQGFKEETVGGKEEKTLRGSCKTEIGSDTSALSSSHD